MTVEKCQADRGDRPLYDSVFQVMTFWFVKEKVEYFPQSLNRVLIG
jgi:hypothetical protein